MANKGFICFDGYLERTAKLSDQEVGRLFRACMVYHATGEVLELTGRESIAFDFIREDIDAANKAYDKKCKQNKENADKRWDDANACERMPSDANGCDRMRTDATQCEPMRSDAKGGKRNNNEKEKEIFIDDDNARAIQLEQDRVLNAAEDAGFKMSNDVRASLIALYAEHGLQKILDSLMSCVDHGAPNLAYLKACLRGEPKKEKPSGKKVTAQTYDQRDYEGEQAEALNRMVSRMKGAC